MRKTKIYSGYFMHISSFISSLATVLRNEDKLAALKADSSFTRVAANLLRRIFVSSSSGSQIRQAELKRGMKRESLRIQYSTTAQLSGWNDCDVTRLGATKHARNEQIFTPSVFHAALQSHFSSTYRKFHTSLVTNQ